MISYQIENNLSAKEFQEILYNSTLGERRPADDIDRLKAMIEHSNLIITARHHHQLIGVARSITDFVYCTYLSDLAVKENYQKKGIGKELIKRTKIETPKANLILLAAPRAIDYYPHLGMTKHPACFVLNNVNKLK